MILNVPQEKINQWEMWPYSDTTAMEKSNYSGSSGKLDTFYAVLWELINTFSGILWAS